MKSYSQYTTDLSSIVAVEQRDSLQLISTIIYNPLHGVGTEEYSDSSIEQRIIYIKSKCKEAEIVILTLSKMFEGEIINLEIPELNLSVPCILKTNKKLTSNECGHIKSVSPHLEII